MTAYDMICTQSRHAWFRLCNPNCSGLIYTVNESRLLSVLKGDFFPQILLMGGAPRWSAASHAGIICNKSQFTDPLTPRTLLGNYIQEMAEQTIQSRNLLLRSPQLYCITGLCLKLRHRCIVVLPYITKSKGTHQVCLNFLKLKWYRKHGQPTKCTHLHLCVSRVMHVNCVLHFYSTFRVIFVTSRTFNFGVLKLLTSKLKCTNFFIFLSYFAVS